MKKNYDVCVFDLDGTLVNSLKDLANSCNEALALFDLPTHGIDEYRYFVGNGILNLIKNALGEKAADEQLVQSVYNTFNLIYKQRCLDYTIPYDGITQMLIDIRFRGVKVGVLSNKADEFARHIVSSLFDSGLIDVTYGQRKNFPKKPAPDSFFYLLDDLGCTRERCLYVGDSDVDVFTAKNAGVDFCGAQWGFRGRGELIKAGAEKIAETPKDLTDIILR